MEEIFGEPIYTYTREQAIEDGELVDVTEYARQAGFKLPAVLSRNLFATCSWDQESFPDHGQSYVGRLMDVLHLGFMAVRSANRLNHDTDRITYKVLFIDEQTGKMTERHVVVHIGPGDMGEPVLTFMHPEDD